MIQTAAGDPAAHRAGNTFGTLQKVGNGPAALVIAGKRMRGWKTVAWQGAPQMLWGVTLRGGAYEGRPFRFTCGRLDEPAAA